MAETEPSLVAAGGLALPPEKEEGAGLSSGPERNSAGSSSTPEAPGSVWGGAGPPERTAAARL